MQELRPLDSLRARQGLAAKRARLGYWRSEAACLSASWLLPLAVFAAGSENEQVT